MQPSKKFIHLNSILILPKYHVLDYAQYISMQFSHCHHVTIRYFLILLTSTQQLPCNYSYIRDERSGVESYPYPV